MEMVTVAVINKDHLAEKWDDDTYNRVGRRWAIMRPMFNEMFPERAKELFPSFNPKEQKKFRCKDDDGEVYYSGWLYDDNEGYVQFMVLETCLHDAGCTTIEIRKDRKWVQDIG